MACPIPQGGHNKSNNHNVPAKSNTEYTYSSQTSSGRFACRADICAASWDTTTSPIFYNAQDVTVARTANARPQMIINTSYQLSE